MLTWSMVFFAIALVSWLLGFTGLSGTAEQIAKILFKVSAIVFVISLVVGFLT